MLQMLWQEILEAEYITYTQRYYKAYYTRLLRATGTGLQYYLLLLLINEEEQLLGE